MKASAMQTPAGEGRVITKPLKNSQVGKGASPVNLPTFVHLAAFLAQSVLPSRERQE